MSKNWRQGEQYVWASATIVTVTLLMAVVLIAVVLFNGLGYFWPSSLVRVRLTDGTVLLGEENRREEGVAGGAGNLQLKVGNRDLYGQDFRWVKGGEIATRETPTGVVRLEREEHGNFFGTLESLALPGLPGAHGESDSLWERFRRALEEVRAQKETLDEAREALGDLGGEMESLQQELRALAYGSGGAASVADSPAVRALVARRAALQARFEKENTALAESVAGLNANTARFRDAGGKEKDIPLAVIVRAVRPNDMSLLAKIGFYISKIGELLFDEPRESNTEGGLFPAIFGTVMMVVLMSMFSLPLGVVAAIYLREYAKEGFLVRLVRIAVYNLAGVPSIVFGVFGLGFFIYGVGGAMDQFFFPERLPTPTFGTGGIFWASLTLALLTVPVVIVSTEEGLSAIPRGLREASQALGATRFQTLVRVVLPMAVPGILTGFILAMARAAGEVAPLMITGVVKLAPSLPIDGTFPFVHLERKFMHLGFHIYDVGFQSPNVEAAKPMVYITTMVLVLLVLCLSLTAIILRNKMRKRFQTSTF